MRFTDLIFDLYGTLVDIHTEEDAKVWEKTALYFGFYGAHYTPEELKTAFRAELRSREATSNFFIHSGQRHAQSSPAPPVIDA